MRAVKIILFGLLPLVITVSLSAWERKAEIECNQEEIRCKNEVEQCRELNRNCTRTKDKCQDEAIRCRKRAAMEDESSFIQALSSKSFRKYQLLTEKQKKRVLDYADHNRMQPDDAVAKVSP